MTYYRLLKFKFLILILIFITYTVNSQSKQEKLKLIKTISLPNVHGKFDHIAVDVKNSKLFLAAKGNNSVEVVDLINDTICYSIKNVSAPQGILFKQEDNIIIVCSGGDGTLKGFDGTDYKLRFSLDLGSSEADNIRYSSIRQRIYVAFGNGAIAVIDANSYKKLSEISCLAHPEAFSLDSMNNKMWINVPDKGLIKVVDIDSEKEIDQWKTASQQDNFPMVFIEKKQKIIVASRLKSEISILDAKTGKLLQFLNCDSDPDAMYYDDKSDKIFLSCGGGSIYIFYNISADIIEKPTIISTRKGARTCKWIPIMNTLFVALPETNGEIAELRLYSLE